MGERIVFVLVILILSGTVPEWKPLVIRAYEYATSDAAPPPPALAAKPVVEPVHVPAPAPLPEYREEKPIYSYEEERARIQKILADRRAARERAAKARKKKRCIPKESFPRIEYHERPRGFEIGIRFR